MLERNQIYSYDSYGNVSINCLWLQQLTGDDIRFWGFTLIWVQEAASTLEEFCFSEKAVLAHVKTMKLSGRSHQQRDKYWFPFNRGKFCVGGIPSSPSPPLPKKKLHDDDIKK